MKYLVVILLFGVLGATWADEDADKAEQICFEKLDITKADLEGDFEKFEDVPEKAKCAFKCLLQEMGMWSDEGITYLKSMTTLMNLLSEATGTDASELQSLTKCAESIPVDMDQCEAAFKLAICMEKEES